MTQHSLFRSPLDALALSALSARVAYVAVFVVTTAGSLGCAPQAAESPQNVSLASSAPSWASQVAVGEPSMTFDDARPQGTHKRGSGVQQGLRPSRSAQPTAQ